MRDLLNGAAGRLLLIVVRGRLRLGERGARRLEAALAWLWFHVLRARRRVAECNVRRAFGPERDAAGLVRDSFRHWIAAFSGLLPLFRDGHAAYVRGTVVEGEAHLRAALAEGRGVIAVSAHFGPFPALGAVLPTLGATFALLYRRPGGAPVARLFDEGRARAGGGSIEDQPRASALARCLGALARGEVVCLLVDQHYRAGAPVSFLGTPARTGLGAALLAARSGAPLLPVVLFRLGNGGMRLVIEAPVAGPDTREREALAACMARLTARVEAWIRESPAQWFWMHRRWKDLDTS